MKQFKAEFKHSKILVKTNSLGKVEINTDKADPEKWANVPELAFMFEDVQEVKAKKAEIKIEIHEVNQDDEGITKQILTSNPPHGVRGMTFGKSEEKMLDNSAKSPEDEVYEKPTLKELRAEYPHIKATSVDGFLQKLEEERNATT
jgi:hypothetical protein